MIPSVSVYTVFTLSTWVGAWVVYGVYVSVCGYDIMILSSEKYSGPILL